VRDLLLALDFGHATVVGHSLGGGVAMAYVYQFPENVDRMVLVSSGGLGREAALPLRLASLPGIPAVLALAASRSGRRLGCGVLRACGLDRHPAARYAKRQLENLAEPAARAALTGTLRGVMDLRGQRMSAADRLYLAQDLPVLFVVSAGDRLIPAQQSIAAQHLVPGSRLEVLEGTSHFPQMAHPEQLADLLRDFVTTTQPRQLGGEVFRDRLLEGPVPAERVVPRQPSHQDRAGLSGAGGSP
jgi:pimeloyl-ACP methyl ester carboxylesterase